MVYHVQFPGLGLDLTVNRVALAIGTVMAIVCARIYYVAMAPFAYQSLWEMIDIRKGGIAIYGAVIGAFVFGALAAKWRKVPLLPLFDLVSLGFLIGQGIGRWGNFVKHDAALGHVQRGHGGVSQIRAGHAARGRDRGPRRAGAPDVFV